MLKTTQIKSRVNAIAKELSNGADREGILKKYCKKFNIGARQIDNYIKKAKPIAEIQIQEDKETQKDAREEGTKEAIKSGLKTFLDVDAKLQEIIFSTYRLVRDPKDDLKRVIKVENTTSDQLKAIEIYYKRHGHYAPIKNAQTDSEGNDVEITFTSIKKEEALSKIK